jgi:hypothetical protein
MLLGDLNTDVSIYHGRDIRILTLPEPPAPTTMASYSWSMIGYLFPIKGETSFALRLPDGVMIFLTGAVREKLRAEACRAAVWEAAKRRSPEENILEAAAPAEKSAGRGIRAEGGGVERQWDGWT